MAEVEIKNAENKTVDKLALKDEIFALPVRTDVLHESVVNYLANQRQGTHATKTRGRVSGGGKKPWRQKHTGRARAGSIRSPLWKGGGTVFGPQPRDYSYSMNKKQRRLALKTALSSKLSENQILVVDSFGVDEPKTKKMTALLSKMGLEGKKVLIVTKDKDENVYLSARNIPNIKVKRSSDLNTYSIMVHEFLLITKDALLSMQEVM
ncbi:50S ribosomal protein L4 [bacterium BMS3Abin07]|nr:50S ribosomal protein L4 [bacterium BMS3Abin07]GBE33386.1 50S ribosomal protein L4 [bacterium BMS3Bbin05]HDL20432.1 50S ribosomal protein L4 [Nitrospirota bacterium]HDO21937.1 50S ribosomal protein L4 [Nitrospirota bacterium]HDZ87735.1 50S ribosomal protein L4 [Nitrospirota bacterium]